MNKTIFVSVATTLAVLLAVFGLGAVAVRTAVADPLPVLAGAAGVWHDHGRGHGMNRACAKLDEQHVSEHAAELNRWISGELALDDTQTAALSTATGTLGDWALDLRSVCEMPLADAPSHVAAAARVAQTADIALQRFAAGFDAFYATLNPEQRAKLDGWFAHRHRHES